MGWGGRIDVGEGGGGGGLMRQLVGVMRLGVGIQRL